MCGSALRDCIEFSLYVVAVHAHRPEHRGHSDAMRLFSCPLFLLHAAFSCTNGDLHAELEALVDQKLLMAKLHAQLADVRHDVRRLRSELREHVASTQQRLDPAGGERQLSTGTVTQGGDLGGVCADPSAPRLVVEGVCSCTSDLLLNGSSVVAGLRNIAMDLNDVQDAVSAMNTTMNTCHNMAGFLSLSVTGDLTGIGAPTAVTLSSDGRYAFLACKHADGIYIVDVASDPSNPTVVGSLTDEIAMEWTHGISMSQKEDYVYVTGYRSNSLAVVGVGTSLTSPVVVGTLNGTLSLPWTVRALASGQLVYVTGLAGSMWAVNVTNPAAPFVVWELTGFGYAYGSCLSPDEQFLYVTSRYAETMFVVDVRTDPFHPRVVGNVTDASLAGCWGISTTPDGRYIVVAASIAHAITLLDTSLNSTHPPVIGTVTDPMRIGEAAQIAVSLDGKTVFATTYHSNHVLAVDIRSPEQPVIRDSLEVPYAGYIVTSPNGRHVIAANGDDNRLTVVEVGSNYWCVDPGPIQTAKSTVVHLLNP